jgi:tetratricopeptide (TPR) repeat protein
MKDARQLKLPSANSRTTPVLSLSCWRLWRWRVLAAVGVPVALLVLAEAGLRLAGFGYPTAFFLPSANRGKPTLVQNNRFGWRFFGPEMSRMPSAISISRVKPPGTIRIFVFGESAAFGDPQPAFGLPRVLQAMLSLRHPGVRFEVVNVAMTGINSHAIVAIARDCARARGDIWVIYMGNNEVVGPFGAGTVFGQQVPPLPIVRANLALGTTRVGQFLGLTRRALDRETREKTEWGGMQMFLDHQVRAADPRLQRSHLSFRCNLADIVRLGHDSGAAVVVSTIAVNLRDSAPFASAFRADLPETEKVRFETLYKRGVEAQAVGKSADAVGFYQVAAEIDSNVADLHFRLGKCRLALGQIESAKVHFRLARDLDTLRFRCDARLNELIRQTVTDLRPDRILLADSEQAFAGASRDGVPGEEWFYDHVHPNFEGNHLLARTILDQVEKLLPADVLRASQAWPTPADCSRRLARTDRDALTAVSEVLSRLAQAPFTLQSNHDEQVRQLTALAQRLDSGDNPAARLEALELCREAVAASPDDALLLSQLASQELAGGSLAEARAAAERSLELVPASDEIWGQLGLILVQDQEFEQAITAFRRVLELDSRNVGALHDMAHSLARLNRKDEAANAYRRALQIKPHFGPAWLGLGELLETMGQNAEAEKCYRQALANRVRRAPELTVLARFCQQRGWFEAAATNYMEAGRLSPSDANLPFEAGRSLASVGRHAEAVQCYAEAVRLAPGWGQAHFLYGLELGRLDKPAEAESAFREAARLMPDLVEARLNLGIALASQQKIKEALAEFETVLEYNPTNTLALEYRQNLRQKAGPEAKP